MELLLQKLSFFSGYVFGYSLLVIGVIVLLVIGALLIYFGKSKIGKRNLFLLVVYRLLQLYFIVEVIYLVVILSAQLFSFKPYTFNKKTGTSFGLLWLADGYRVPVQANYKIPKRHVSITAKVDSSVYTFIHNSEFSSLQNRRTAYIDSMSQRTMPFINGKDHVSYIRNDTIQNLIHINFPVGHTRLTADNRLVFNDSTVSFVPPSYSNAKAFIRSSSGWKNFMFSLFTYINIFSGLAIAFFLLKILSSFRKEQLFTRKNFSYVSYVGITLMLYQIFIFVLAIICNQWVIGSVSIRGSSNIAYYEGNMSASFMFRTDFNFSLFIAGFLIILLAQVFKRGFALQKEQELTV